MVRRESAFVLKNDPELLVPLLEHAQEEIEGMGIYGTRTVIAESASRLREALVNTLFHSNLSGLPAAGR